MDEGRAQGRQAADTRDDRARLRNTRHPGSRDSIPPFACRPPPAREPPPKCCFRLREACVQMRARVAPDHRGSSCRAWCQFPSCDFQQRQYVHYFTSIQVFCGCARAPPSAPGGLFLPGYDHSRIGPPAGAGRANDHAGLEGRREGGQQAHGRGEAPPPSIRARNVTRRPSRRQVLAGTARARSAPRAEAGRGPKTTVWNTLTRAIDAATRRCPIRGLVAKLYRSPCRAIQRF